LLDYLRDAARGLDYLNSLGIQHRDVKPHNLLLVGGGVKVADFGLAKLLEQTVASNSGAMTVAYAAPECFGGQISGRSDQYSLAVAYCQLRGGQLPFGGNAMQTMAGHLLQPPDLTMLPEAERPVVARALAKKPEERWPSCRAFVDALAPTGQAAAPASLPDTQLGPPPTPPVPPPPAPSRRIGLLPAGLVAAALLAVLVGVWQLLSRPDPTHRATNPDRPQPPPSTGLAAAPTKAQRPEPRKEEPTPRDPDKVEASPGKQATDVSEKDIRTDARKQSDSEPTRAPTPTLKETVNSLGMKLVRIPAGKFLRGSPATEADRWDDEGPQHEIEITQPFYMGVYEVTQEEYEKVMGTNPSWFSAQGGGKSLTAGIDTRRFPVERVSWNDAVEFCRRLSDLPEERRAGRAYGLPTEAEWEYACRGGAPSSEPFHFGQALSVDQANIAGKLGRTTAVGQYPPNGYGLYDMHGNVCEWCRDRRGTYPRGFAKDPTGPENGTNRVVRGGWWDGPARYARTAYRSDGEPSRCNIAVGFRVVMRLGGRAP
jgi:formylglycine-generating enzyme required for sulfatase activity